MNAFVAKVEGHTTNEVSNRGGFSSVFPLDLCLTVYNLVPSVRPSRERTHNGSLVEEVGTHRVSGSPGMSARTARWLNSKWSDQPSCSGQAHLGERERWAGNWRRRN